jgi:hypothetical protein
MLVCYPYNINGDLAMNEENAYLSIITMDVQSVPNEQNFFPSPAKVITKAMQVSSAKLASELNGFTKRLHELIEQLPEADGNFRISEVTFNVTVDGAGKFALIGEISAGIASSITVKFSRRPGS